MYCWLRSLRSWRVSTTRQLLSISTSTPKSKLNSLTSQDFSPSICCAWCLTLASLSFHLSRCLSTLPWESSDLSRLDSPLMSSARTLSTRLSFSSSWHTRCLVWCASTFCLTTSTVSSSKGTPWWELALCSCLGSSSTSRRSSFLMSQLRTCWTTMAFCLPLVC